MKIVQTFWSGGRNPLEHSYGWPHAEYNLMSWTLSCLSLRQHYDRVELYTDRRGYEVLIERLHLPYTRVHVIYDDDLCLPQHWAYAKIKTYSLQTEPFLHIDGDMYFPKPLPQELLDAPLVAQNREIGTAYYQGMMNRVLAHSEFQLPQFIRETLDNGTMASYNMGVFGGNDLDFIHRYCQEVFTFFEANRMNDASVEYSNEECNVFFEQIFLAAMVDREKREVKGLVRNPICDDGYSVSVFCDIQNFEYKKFFHILGGHKRNINIIRSLAKSLLCSFPDHFWSIIETLPTPKRIKLLEPPCSTNIQEYKKWVWNIMGKWQDKDISHEIRNQEEKASHNKYVSEAKCLSLTLRLPRYMEIFDIPKEWHEYDIGLLKRRFYKDKHFPLKSVVIVPLSHWIGYEEFPMKPIDNLIISCLSKREKDYCVLETELLCAIKCKTEEGREREKKYIREETNRLIQHGILLTF